MKMVSQITDRERETLVNKPVTMMVLTANTPEDFIFEQLQQSHGMTKEQAAKAIEGLKERGIYDDLLLKAGEALGELNSHLRRGTQTPTGGD